MQKSFTTSRLASLAMVYALASTGLAIADPVPTQSAMSPMASEPAIVAYVDHPGPPELSEFTVGDALVGGAVGGLIGLAQGRDIARSNNIVDPAGRIARRIALAFSASRGAKISPQPIEIVDRFSPSDQIPNATNQPIRYVVDVQRSQILLGVRPLHWDQYDIILGSRVRIIDLTTKAVVYDARCNAKRDFSDQYSHGRLLANQAEALKKLILRRADQCVSQIETAFGLSDVPDSQPQGLAVEMVEADANVCDADKARYAAQIGVPCSALGAKVYFATPPEPSAQ